MSLLVFFNIPTAQVSFQIFLSDQNDENYDGFHCSAEIYSRKLLDFKLFEKIETKDSNL